MNNAQMQLIQEVQLAQGTTTTVCSANILGLERAFKKAYRCQRRASVSLQVECNRIIDAQS
jgi:hypothetical protein